MASSTLPQAARVFEQFYVPRFEILAGGAQVQPGVLRDIVQVTYNDSITEIDSFEVTVNNWDSGKRQFKYVGSEARTDSTDPLHVLFEPGARDFELKLGYGSELRTIIKGSPTSLEPSFPAGGAPSLTVRALNVLAKLRTKQYRDSWSNKRISEIVEEIGRKSEPDGCKRFPIPIRLAPPSVRQREPRLLHVTQENQFDIDFFLIEARKIGYVVYIDLEQQPRGPAKEVLYFGPSNARSPAVPDICYELKWGISLIDFNPKLSTANQARSIEVRSWDRKTNKSIRKKVGADHPDIRVNRDLLRFVDPGKPCGGSGGRPREEVVVNEPQFTPEQAERRAIALMEEKLKQLVEATGTTIGLPELRAGQRVKIVGLGARFSGTYFVIKTTHTINDSGYVTKFTARREQGESA